MSENNTEKNLDETIEENVYKAFDGNEVMDVMYGSKDDIKKMISERNESVIKNAEEHDIQIAHVSIEDVGNIAFPFKNHLILASDGGIGVIGNIDPADLVNLLSNITKTVLVRYGVDPDDKAQFNMKAAVAIMLAAIDFMSDSSMPHKVVNRFKRLMDSIEDLIKD